MRLILAALLMGGAFCTPALAASPKAGPVKVIDYGDMRCAFAVRHHEVMDSHIVAWANGFIQGYVRSGHGAEAAEHVVGLRGPEELNDATVMREHIRGYCIKHRNNSILAAVLGILRHPHATATGEAQPHRPAQPQSKSPAPQKALGQPKTPSQSKIPLQSKVPAQP